MYFVRLSVSGSSRVVLDALETPGEDAGRAAGWSINNFVLQRRNGSGSTADWSSPHIGIVRIRVNGTAGATTDPMPDTSCAAPDLAGRDRIWTGEVTVGAGRDFGNAIQFYGFDATYILGTLVGRWTARRSTSARTPIPSNSLTSARITSCTATSRSA